MAPVVQTRALTVQFGPTTALDAVDVEVGGGVTGLVGANGAGKTTLFSTLLGLLRPTSGAVSVLGLEPRRNGRELRASVGYGSERNVFPDDLRAYGEGVAEVVIMDGTDHYLWRREREAAAIVGDFADRALAPPS